jgi:hypothetical protein
MPVSSGGSGIAGDSARLFPWQVDHNCVRGGPNDPVVQTTPAIPAQQTGGGSLSWNTTLTLPPVPGVQPAVNRTMTINSTGTLTSGQLTTNTGGLYLLTIPQGAWIESLSFFCYAAMAGGTSTSLGFFYTAEPADLAYPPATLNLLAYITTPTANTLYSSVATGGGATSFTSVLGAGGTSGGNASPLGPGNAQTGIGQLASLSDIDIYVATFLVAGAGTANTGGCYSAMFNFTGLEG